MKQWYVVHCQPSAERKALFHLNRQGYAAYLPVYRKTRRHARRVDEVSKPLFPRYLFIHLDIETDAWLAVRSTVGVSHIVCNGETPAAVPNGVVEAIQAREDERGHVALADFAAFKPGDQVRLTDGPLADQVGLFAKVADDHRVIVLLELLGRSVQVRVAKDAISAAA